MRTREEARARLAEIPNVTVSAGTPLSRYTRFGLGGPADIFAESGDVEAFLDALGVARSSGLGFLVIGGGTNLVVSDEGYRGIILRFTGNRIAAEGRVVSAEAGAGLQSVVDFAISRGLAGIETLAGIPGTAGAAVYGNAGAYGHSISERVLGVRFFDGHGLTTFGPEECLFAYRESVFKRRKSWVIFSVDLGLEVGDAAELARTAGHILALRNEKFPPTMKCAGSVFKNLLAAQLPPTLAESVPPHLVREGKIPAAYFLEQVGAKGMKRGGIHVASYHANLIYNQGGGTARDLRGLIGELKQRVLDRFGIRLEEEVQYVGFEHEALAGQRD